MYLREGISIALFVLMAPATLANEIVIFDGEREIKLNETYKVTGCKNIALAECQNCLDAPNYYFFIETRQLISQCGGACWHPKGKQKEMCETLCPPAKWECSTDQ